MAFTSYIDDAGRVDQIFRHRPDIYRPFAEANARLMRGPSELTEAERELIGAYSSALGGCDYCAGAHGATARLFGVEEGLLEAMVADLSAAPLDEKSRALMVFIRKLCLNGPQMVQADAGAVFAAGWSEEALHDAIAVSAFFAFMNRLVQGCIFRDIRPPIPTTSAHLYRGIRPALTRCREALVFDISFLAFRHVVEGLSFGRIVRRVRAGRRCAPAGRGWHLRRWVHQ